MKTNGKTKGTSTNGEDERKRRMERCEGKRRTEKSNEIDEQKTRTVKTNRNGWLICNTRFFVPPAGAACLRIPSGFLIFGQFSVSQTGKILAKAHKSLHKFNEPM